MVTTRRSGANAVPIPSIPPRPLKRRKVTISNTSDQPGKPVSTQPWTSRTSSTSTNSKAPNRPSSELSELTFTSSSNRGTPHHVVPTTVYRRKQAPAKPSTEQILAALKKLTAPGSSHNPIVLLEDYPTPEVQPTSRDPSKVEPHMFLDRHSKLYDYSTPRPALAPRSGNGSTFTGHPGHDTYRMRTAKTAAPDWHVGGAQRAQLGVPLEMQYPISTRYLASQPGTVSSTARPNVPHLPPHLLACLHYAAPVPLSEEQLRSKALQYVREHSRTSPRKRKMAEDADETSDSDSTEVDMDTAPASRRSPVRAVTNGHAKFKSGPVTTMPGPHSQLTPPVEQASLLTSLLRVYPQSRNQKGLREDIAMLASVQNQHLADWLNFEVGRSRKMASPHAPRVSRGSAMSPTKPANSTVTASELAEMEMRRKQDNEIRGFLSADAKVWQDGSGLSVADVFSDDRISAPAEGHDAEVEAREVKVEVTATSPARVTSPPVARASGRKRMAPARLKVE